MSSKPLERRLGERGSSYRALAESIGRDFAKRYLVDSQLRLQQIAYLLGYSESASLARAFKRWTGSTPISNDRARRVDVQSEDLDPRQSPRVWPWRHHHVDLRWPLSNFGPPTWRLTWRLTSPSGACQPSSRARQRLTRPARGAAGPQIGPLVGKAGLRQMFNSAPPILPSSIRKHGNS